MPYLAKQALQPMRNDRSYSEPNSYGGAIASMHASFWKCSRCGEYNLANRFSCTRCASTRDGAAAVTAEGVAGLWPIYSHATTGGVEYNSVRTGQHRTHERNERRRQSNKLKHLRRIGALPGDTDLTAMYELCGIDPPRSARPVVDESIQEMKSGRRVHPRNGERACAKRQREN